MATIRRRNDKWQAQVRHKGFPEVYKTFSLKTDALAWARAQERQADKGELGKPRLNLSQIMLSELVERYQQTGAELTEKRVQSGEHVSANLRNQMLDELSPHPNRAPITLESRIEHFAQPMEDNRLVACTQNIVVNRDIVLGPLATSASAGLAIRMIRPSTE